MKIKNYRIWHIAKSFIHNDRQRPYFHQSEVWFCSMGENVGFEIDGKGTKFLRPVIVIKKFNNESLWAMAMTSRSKQGKYYLPVAFGKRTGSVILSQLRLIDSKRLIYKIGKLGHLDFQKITKELKDLIP